VKHFASPEFWSAYRRLPANIRALADKNFALLKSDPRHPSLHFKQIGRFHSARIGCAIAHSQSKPTTACCGSGSAHTPTMMRC
jgi:hypothetical protein